MELIRMVDLMMSLTLLSIVVVITACFFLAFGIIVFCEQVVSVLIERWMKRHGKEEA